MKADGRQVSRIERGFTLTEILFAMAILSIALLTMLLALGDSRKRTENREAEAAYYRVASTLRNGIHPDFERQDWRLEVKGEMVWLDQKANKGVFLVMSRQGDFLYLADDSSYASGVGAETVPSFLVSIRRSKSGTVELSGRGESFEVSIEEPATLSQGQRKAKRFTITLPQVSPNSTTP